MVVMVEVRQRGIWIVGASSTAYNGTWWVPGQAVGGISLHSFHLWKGRCIVAAGVVVDAAGIRGTRGGLSSSSIEGARVLRTLRCRHVRCVGYHIPSVAAIPTPVALSLAVSLTDHSPSVRWR